MQQKWKSMYYDDNKKCWLIDKLIMKNVCLSKQWVLYGSIKTKPININIILLRCLIMTSDINIHSFITFFLEDSDKLGYIFLSMLWKSNQTKGLSEQSRK